MSNFHPLEVVNRGSETQLQLGGNKKTKTDVNENSTIYHLGIATADQV